MRDIKLTLAKDPAMRSPNVEAEAKWMEEEGAIYYQLPSQPKEAQAGCFVYFVRDSQLVARAKANDFLYMEADEVGASYTGVKATRGCWRVEVVPPMEIAKRPIVHQGFRYVQGDEKASFERAFNQN